jgi:PAS domain S-box-containing protein
MRIGRDDAGPATVETLIVRSSHDAIITIDAELRITSWNGGAEAMYGYAAEEVLGRSSDIVIPVDAPADSRGLRERGMSGAKVRRFETRRLRKDGTLIDVAITVFPLRDAAGNAYGAGSIATDITARKRTERALAASEVRYREILDTTPDGVWRVDADDLTDYVNQRMAEMLGLEPEEMIGRPLSDFLDAERMQAARDAMATARREGQPSVAESCFTRSDGTACWARVSHTPLKDPHGNPCGALAIMSDVTASKTQAAELRATEHFLAALTDSMAEGMFALDRDGRVTYMNQAAEQLLGWSKDELATRSMHDTTHYQHEDGSPRPRSDCPLLHVLRTGATVRVDDDAFTHRDGRLLPVTYSAAPIAVDDEVRGIVVVFSDVTAGRTAERARRSELETLTWVGRIREALDEQRLVLYGQPIIDVHSRAVVAHELLLRMVARDGAIIAPGRFLPAAERYGLIEEIDRWVAAQATILAGRGLKVHFNISGRSLGSRALLGDLAAALHAAPIDPAKLVCEITETAIAEDAARAEAFVRELAQLGCGIALDDFGTGYGGFSYLKRLPVRVLKIDVEFVRDLVGNSKNQHVVKAIVGLAQGFGGTTIAEGVESEDTLALLQEYGVDYAQGFGIGLAAPVSTLGACDASVVTARQPRTRRAGATTRTAPSAPSRRASPSTAPDARAA